MSSSEQTPMMRQYNEAKAACPGALLLFRMGDFYELFGEDAKTAAQVLGLALTSREKGANPMPMSGFPHHQLDSYVGKLISAGFRAAVCEQVEDPKKAKGIVRREVVRVVTPGTVTEESLLDPKKCNYLAAIVPGVEKGATNCEVGAGSKSGVGDEQKETVQGVVNDPLIGLSWVELSTGQFQAGTFPQSQIADQLARIGPSECLLAESSEPLIPGPLRERMMLTRRPVWAFGLRTAHAILLKQLGVSTLEGFGFTETESEGLAIRAAGGIIEYLLETQRDSLIHIDSLIPYNKGGQLEIDEASRRSLEIHETLRNRRREGSLIAVLDQCMTSMGSRLLGDWVGSPLTRIGEITLRQDAVQELLNDDGATRAIREQLRKVYDLQRLLTRVLQNRANPRDLGQVGQTLRVLPFFKEAIAEKSSTLLRSLHDFIDPCESVAEQLKSALKDDCPLSSREGGFIRDGYNQELDSLRDLQSGGKRWIAEYQMQESQRTGIANLKIGFNRVFGYYIEVSNSNSGKIPESYIRKQTIRNAERYITPELKEYEEKVLSAGERANELESVLFEELREQVVGIRASLQKSAHALAFLDVLASLAVLARERGYCRPRLVEEPVLMILEGRHPVLDKTESAGTFVPNDTCANERQGNIQLITGPNMAGKSTFIRQVALLTLMSQMGSFIPAKEATIGVVDRIFARVGASDELSRGQSTFMVEMTETARILHLATPQSLVILDEIGRGTSTYDGISLAWSIVEFLHDQIGCRTFFATHYHELTDLADMLENVANLNVAVREWNEEIAFLHKIVPGAADKSYGIHVARLAGIPKEVISRAREILADLEQTHLDAGSHTGPVGKWDNRQNEAGGDNEKGRGNSGSGERADFSRNQFVQSTESGAIQFSLFGPEDHPILEDLRKTNVNELTPIDALKLLSEWKEQLERDARRLRRR
ncbi:MAG: DNA mismatch repair protein MutS [Thermoguttaceae bacterium]